MPPARPPGRRGGGAIGALAALRRGEVPPVCLLTGPEAFLRAEFVRTIRRAVLEEGAKDFNDDRFDWAESDVSEIAAAAQTLPFMSPRRLVEVHGLERVNEREAAVLLSLLESLPPTSVLLFVAEKADKRLKVFRRMSEAGAAFRMETPHARDLPAWLGAQAEDLGFTLRPEAAALLVEIVEPSLGRLRAEAEKLASYVGPGGTAGEEEVRDLVGRSRVEAAYHLGEALASGDTRRALGIIRRVGEAGSPHILLGALRNQIRRWTIAKAAHRKRIRAGNLAEMLGVRPFAAERLQQQAKGASALFLRRLYARLLEADRRIKRMSDDRRICQVLEVFAMEMGAAPGGFARGVRRTDPAGRDRKREA